MLYSSVREFWSFTCCQATFRAGNLSLKLGLPIIFVDWLSGLKSWLRTCGEHEFGTEEVKIIQCAYKELIVVM